MVAPAESDKNLGAALMGTGQGWHQLPGHPGCLQHLVPRTEKMLESRYCNGEWLRPVQMTWVVYKVRPASLPSR